MKLVIKEKLRSEDIQVGDIIVLGGDTYMIQEDPHGWVAKSMDGYGGATGRKNSLQELVESFDNHDIEHYSKNKYELVLVPKSKN